MASDNIGHHETVVNHPTLKQSDSLAQVTQSINELRGILHVASHAHLEDCATHHLHAFVCALDSLTHRLWRDIERVA